MSEMSDYLENKLLDLVLSNVAYSVLGTVHLGLSTASITDTTTGTTITEPSGNGYARKAVTNNTTNFPAASSRSKSLNVTQTFATPTGSWGTITDMAILDAATLGNVLFYTALTSSKAVASGNTVEFTASNITVSFNSTNISDYLANALLDHMLGGTAFSPDATYYMALCTAAPTSASTGSTITEPSGNNYSRLAITNNATNFPAASGGSKSNGAAWTFATPSGTWGTITHWALCSASTAGNVLFHGALSASAAPGNGDTVRFQAGAWTFSFL